LFLATIFRKYILDIKSLSIVQIRSFIASYHHHQLINVSTAEAFLMDYT
jgi:hypothetical protein